MRGLLVAALAALVASGACGTDQVEIRFVTGRDDIAEIRMAVYAEGDVALSCEGLEFSEIDPETLAQALVVEVSGAPGERVELGEIPRAGLKLFFAEAITSAGISVLAGCASHGAITGDVTIEITPRDRLVILPAASIEVIDDQVAVDGLVVTDLGGAPQIGSEVHETLTGPANFVLEGTTSTGEGATRILRPSPPSPGPLRFELRASWAKPVQLTAVKAPPSTDLELPAGAATIAAQGLADTLQVGRFGDGEVGVVALLDSGAGRVAQLHCFEGSLAPAQSSVEPLADVVSLGLLRDPGEGDRVIAASGTEWTELSCAAPALTRSSPFAGRPGKLVAMPGCDGDADPALYAQLGPGEIAVADPFGEVLTDFSEALPPDNIGDNLGLRTSGCVEDQLGAANPTIVLSLSRGDDDPTFRTLIAARVDGVPQVGQIGVLTTAVSAESISTGPGGLQLGRITAEGPAIERYDLQPLANGTLTAGLVGVDPTPSQVTELASGDVDGDGLTDLVALLAFANSSQIFVSLALPGTGDRLRGFFAGPVTDRSAKLRVADVDQDGDDDIVLFGSEMGTTRLTVLEMGRPAP